MRVNTCSANTIASLLLLLCGIQVQETALASEPTPEAVRAWLDQELSSASKVPDLSGHSVTWRVELWYVPPPEELERMRKDIAGKPDHPDRQTLECYEQALKKKPYTTRYRLWSHGTGNWRYNSEWGYGNDLNHYWDKTLTPRNTWMLLEESLEVFEHDSSFRGGADLPSLESSFGPELETMFCAHLSTLSKAGFTRGVTTVAGNTWRVVFTKDVRGSKARAEIAFSGRWDDAQGRGFVEEERIVSSPDAASVGRLTRYKEWSKEASLDRFVAYRVEQYTPENRLDRVTVFEEAKAEEEGEFDRVTAIPPTDGSDPVRGKTTFTRITDHRTNRQSIVAPGRGVESSARLPVQTAVGSIWQRRLGWIVSGCLVMGLVVMAVYRRKKTMRA